MASFSVRDPAQPQFWDERFAQGVTPWDRGGVPQALQQFVADAAQPLRCLIPGCGTAHELALLSEAGWDAVAIDFSPEAVARARARLGALGERVLQADFFSYQPAVPLQLIYERAFLCAMPPTMWAQVAARWAALLAPGTLLVGYFFFDEQLKGPPFGITPERLTALLAPHFDCLDDQPASDSIAVFAGKERWMVWQRRAGAFTAA